MCLILDHASGGEDTDLGLQVDWSCAESFGRGWAQVELLTPLGFDGTLAGLSDLLKMWSVAGNSCSGFNICYFLLSWTNYICWKLYLQVAKTASGITRIIY